MINFDDSRLFARTLSKLLRELTLLHADDVNQIKKELLIISRDDDDYLKALLISHFLEALAELQNTNTAEEKRRWTRNVEKWK